MGDTGSLTIGGIIAVMAFLLRKEFLLPVLCGIFVVENLSVILQVGYFKYTKRNTVKVAGFSKWHRCTTTTKKVECMKQDCSEVLDRDNHLSHHMYHHS